MPKSQGPRSIAKRYDQRGLVLLALAVSAQSPHAGSIFAACTVDDEPVPTRGSINPEIQRSPADRWPWSLVITKLWKLKPRAYVDVAGGQLAERAEIERGKLFRIPRQSESELELWLQEQVFREVAVHRSA